MTSHQENHNTDSDHDEPWSTVITAVVDWFVVSNMFYFPNDFGMAGLLTSILFIGEN